MTKSNVVKLRESEASKSVADFIREHPGAVVAGGVALGLLAGALLSRGSGRKLASQALALAEVAGAASLAFGRQALERAEDAGEAIADQASKLAAPAEEVAETATDAAERLLRKAVELAAKLRG